MEGELLRGRVDWGSRTVIRGRSEIKLALVSRKHEGGFSYVGEYFGLDGEYFGEDGE